MAIDLAPQGVMVTSVGLGVLGDHITEPNTKIIPVHDGFAHFSDDIKLPLTPMIGVMGVATKSGELHCAVPEDHGANMDTKLVRVGSRVYFPVNAEGAGLAVGDMHACMGDGELSGTGIEIAAEITVKVSLVKGFELNWPVLETFGPHGKWYVNASAQEFDEALMNVSKEMQRLLMHITGWDAIDTYMYMSVQSDVELSQACKPCEVQLSLRMGTPKLPQFPPLVPQP